MHFIRGCFHHEFLHGVTAGDLAFQHMGAEFKQGSQSSQPVETNLYTSQMGCSRPERATGTLIQTAESLVVAEGVARIEKCVTQVNGAIKENETLTTT